MFGIKPKFVIDSKEIENALEGRNFSYTGTLPDYFMKIILRCREINKISLVEEYESVFKEIFKKIPYTDIEQTGLYPEAVIKAWKVGKGFYPEPILKDIKMTRQEKIYVINYLASKNGNICHFCKKPMDFSGKEYNLKNNGDEPSIDITENIKNNSECITHTRLRHLKCINAGIFEIKESK